MLGENSLDADERAVIDVKMLSQPPDIRQARVIAVERRRKNETAAWTALVFLAILNVGDIITTRMALNATHGQAIEGNPLAKLLVD